VATTSESCTFQERLWPPWWAWPLGGIAPFMLGVAYGYAISATVGWLVAAVLSAMVTLALVTTTPTIEVSADGVRAKRAYLEIEYCGPAAALDDDQARHLRGVDADARAFSVLRGWLSGAVRLEVADPRDPTPYWYLSTKNPDGLAQAINQVRRAAGHAHVEGFNDDAPASRED
jgi:Protein of unknown function (DUF3093)